ncbi:hypothetical protein E2C01_015170 [Portunus trituberculatus]|uniref:Uncharacterized protein n=1 Tax=Portunus trituberculatus TaxID=210409 RepID=A0A5B7DM36_PORTR|nr:hypothetical protein [Portunus trituberculatus]
METRRLKAENQLKLHASKAIAEPKYLAGERSHTVFQPSIDVAGYNRIQSLTVHGDHIFPHGQRLFFLSREKITRCSQVPASPAVELHDTRQGLCLAVEAAGLLGGPSEA